MGGAVGLDTAPLIRRAEAAGLAPVAALVRLLQGPLSTRHTLLAVCPNSEAVVRAALRAAHRAGAPLLYAATLNQIDLDGGYTGWTPSSFAQLVDEEAHRLGASVPILLCLDHGGPWKKDTHVLQDRSYEESLSAVKRSIEACLEAGYSLLHIDPTVDRRLKPGTPVPVPDIVERTVQLMKHAERYRLGHHLAPVAYEVGTEESGGGLQSIARFQQFIALLKQALSEHDLPLPSFVVGDVGTTLDGTHFDPERARHLTKLAVPLGALIKGHYTDGVMNPEEYPLSGMGGANVGPGFSAVEYDALMDLTVLEQRLGRNSRLTPALREALVESGRWTKWLRREEKGLAFEELPPARQSWLIETGSRYVWTHPSVQKARRDLYKNVAPYRDAEAYVLWRIEEAMMRYYHTFNLIGFNERVETHLEDI